ncbi:MAG: M20/M25/M40 family metallo-hydrolase [Pirellulales bacterium]
MTATHRGFSILRCPAAVVGLALAAIWAGGLPAEQPPVIAPTTAEETALRDRLRESVDWLAAPEREGRGPGTAGIEQAAAWIAERLARIGGLETRVVGEGPFQPFSMTLEATLGPADRNTAELVGPPGPDGAARVVPLELGRDFTPVAAGGSGEFDLPVVFAGYGISAPAEKYDDYSPAGPAVKGAAVVVLRQEPQKDDPHSVFDGNQASQHAALARKVANASEHEAGAVVFCNDTDADGDALMGFTRAGEGSTARTMPVLHVRRSAVDEVVRQSLGRPLAEIQKGIDETLTPASAALAGWRLRGRVAIDRTETTTKNILAFLPGAGRAASGDSAAIDPRETVILGAHYDHLGYGGASSAAPGERAVHHGADDNASGTAMLLEVARRLAAAGPLPRSVLFVAFSGEERGLLGSGHYTANAAVPLADTVAMVNLDMVGRLQDNKVIVHGTGTGSGLETLVDRLVEEHGLEVAKEPGGFGPSDHASFYAKQVPVLHVFTGSHADYHRPTDTADKLDLDGMTRLTGLVADLVTDLATRAERPAYIEVAAPAFARGGDRPYFGSVPDFGKPGKGYAISGVSKDSPAAKGGLQGGDRIVRLGESAIATLEDFDSALRKHKGGDTVPVVVDRGGAEVRLEVTLGPPK